MRLSLTVVDPRGGARLDAVLDVDPSSPVREVARRLTALLDGSGSGSVPDGDTGHQVDAWSTPLLFVDGRGLDPSAPVGGSPLREGTVVSLRDPSGCPPDEPVGAVELRVVGGPGAGAVHRLGIGRHLVGRRPSPGVAVDDPELPDAALALTVYPDGRCAVGTVGAPGGAHPPAVLEGVGLPAGGEVSWHPGGQLSAGNSLLEVVPYARPDAALIWSDDHTGFDYNRPPRLRPADRTTSFSLPTKPHDQKARPLPWLMTLTPLVSSVAMAFSFGNMYYLLISVLSPLAMIGNHFSDRKEGRKSHAKAMKEYRAHKARVEADARQALAAERQDRRLARPDPAAVLGICTGPRTRLWERRRSDGDYLDLRVGTGLLPSAVVLDDPERDDHRRKVTWQIADAPISLPLHDLGVVGFAGANGASQALGRWAVAQLAALHSPADVQICVLTDSSAESGWSWVRWLPHARPTNGQDTNLLVGTDAQTVAARIAELTQMLDARRKAAEEHAGAHAGFADPDVVVVWDGSRRLRTLPGVVRLLREGPEVGIRNICLDAEQRFLPAECQAVAVAEPAPHTSPAGPGPTAVAAPAPVGASAAALPATAAGPRPAVGAGSPPGADPSSALSPAAGPLRLRVEQTMADRITDARPDFVSPSWCLRAARALAPLRDSSGEAEESALPSTSRLLGVIGLEPPTGGAVAGRWRAGGRTTTAVIGESLGGPFALDLRADGPHGLIAGTTGSGKSELLQTIVASLAVANTPEAMTFVLIDYKGGAAFKDCVHLPHTVGMVTDLDAHLVERALESLGAELTRREHILAAAGAKDIEDHQDLVRRDPSETPMPRLLLVIDEFASMVRELPDFVTGLVNIAQRGRSLGIHLLLATQRPSGVVSPEIRANTNLRIALRVTDTAESSDVIDAPEAGQIPKSAPGRAYARLGHASLVPFQTGRVGGRRPGAAGPDTSEPWAAPLAWADLGRAALHRPASDGGEDQEITDLKVLVDAVREADATLAIPAQHSPWLPALDTAVLLDDLLTFPDPEGTGEDGHADETHPGQLPVAPYGLEDLPGEQAQRPVAVDFGSFGHLLIGGAPRSGRSQALRTLAGSLARTHSAADVHMYGIDCGNGALNVLTRLPHCGAVVGRTETERAERLVARLSGELARRQEALAAGGYADIAEQRSAVPVDERLPHVVLFLDRWEGWLPTLGEEAQGELTDVLFTFLREGASVGLHAVFSGDQQILQGRISSLTDEKYGLRLADRSDFSAIGVDHRKVAEQMPPGRAYRGDSGIETQFALLPGEPTGQGQAAALTAIGEAAAERDRNVPQGRRPFRVDVLPGRISFDEAWRVRSSRAQRSKLWTMAGVGGDELTGLGPDLGSGPPSFVIAGPAQSGRSTALLTVARSCLAQGARVVLAAPRPSPLRDLDGRDGVLALFTGEDVETDDLTEAIGSATPDDPVVVLVDDAEDLEDCDAEDVLKSIAARGGSMGAALVIAGDEEEICGGFSGWQVDMKKARRGLLLSPQDPGAGDLVGLRLPRGTTGGAVAPGRGLLHLGDGALTTVTVPGP